MADNLEQLWEESSTDENLDTLWEESSTEDEVKEYTPVQDFLKGAYRAKEEVARSGARLLNEMGIGGYTDEEREFDRAADLRGDSGWDTAGELTTEIGATWMPAGKVFQAASKIPKIPKLLKYALGGGGAGTVASGMTGGDTDDMKAAATGGAILGPLLPAAGKTATRAWDVVRPRVAGVESQVSRALQETLGDRLPGAIQAVKALRSQVPGEKVVTSRAAIADDRLYPEFKTLENYAKRKGGAGELSQIEELNRQARSRVLDDIGTKGRSQGVDPVTKQPLPSQAQAARSAETQPLFREIQDEMVAVPEALEQTIAGPRAVQALRGVTDDATQARLNTVSGGGRPRTDYIPAQPAVPASPVKRGLGGEIIAEGSAGTPAVPAQRSIDNLQNIKNELNSRVQAAVRSGDDETRLLLTEALRQVDDLAGKVPGYGPWKEAYRVASQPQNQADVANILRNSLVQRGTGKESFTPFLNKLDDVPAMTKEAGLPSNMRSMEKIFESAPDDLARINALRGSVGRETQFADLKAPAGILKQPQSMSMAIESVLPPFLTKSTAAIRRALQRTGDVAEKQIDDIMVQLAKNPEDMVKALEAVPPQHRSKIMNIIRNLEGKDYGGMIGATQTED